MVDTTHGAATDYPSEAQRFAWLGKYGLNPDNLH